MAASHISIWSDGHTVRWRGNLAADTPYNFCHASLASALALQAVLLWFIQIALHTGGTHRLAW